MENAAVKFCAIFHECAREMMFHIGRRRCPDLSEDWDE